MRSAWHRANIVANPRRSDPTHKTANNRTASPGSGRGELRSFSLRVHAGGWTSPGQARDVLPVPGKRHGQGQILIMGFLNVPDATPRRDVGPAPRVKPADQQRRREGVDAQQDDLSLARPIRQQVGSPKGAEPFPSAAVFTSVRPGPNIREGISPMAAKFEVFKDKSGEYRWRLKSANGQIIATGGEGYENKAGVENGIAAVQRDAPDAPVEDV
jgi:uncharacterized protein YegP (UPF0339 family)